MHTKEVWKDVKDFEGLYKISNLGRLRSFQVSKNIILKGCVGAMGYRQFTLQKKSEKKYKVYGAHQLVAIAFLGHDPCGHELIVDHINNIKNDNRLENLQVITQRENVSKKIKGSSIYVGVHWSKRNSKWISKIVINKKAKHLGYFVNEIDAHKTYQKALFKLNNNKTAAY